MNTGDDVLVRRCLRQKRHGNGHSRRHVHTPLHSMHRIPLQRSPTAQRCSKTSRSTVYWVPELSHLGSENTAYVPKYSGI